MAQIFILRQIWTQSISALKSAIKQFGCLQKTCLLRNSTEGSNVDIYLWCYDVDITSTGKTHN